MTSITAIPLPALRVLRKLICLLANWCILINHVPYMDTSICVTKKLTQGLMLCAGLQQKVKVKVTLVQALGLCTGRTAHRGSRGIALRFHDHGTRRGWGVSVTPRPLFTPGKDAVPIVQEAGRAPGPVWTSAEKSRSPPGFDPRTVQPVASRYTDSATGPPKTHPDLETKLWRKCQIILLGIRVQSRCQRILTPRDLQYCPDGVWKRGWICEGQRCSHWALHLSGDRASWPSHENGTIFRSISKANLKHG